MYPPNSKSHRSGIRLTELRSKFFVTKYQKDIKSLLSTSVDSSLVFEWDRVFSLQVFSQSLPIFLPPNGQKVVEWRDRGGWLRSVLTSTPSLRSRKGHTGGLPYGQDLSGEMSTIVGEGGTGLSGDDTRSFRGGESLLSIYFLGPCDVRGSISV